MREPSPSLSSGLLLLLLLVASSGRGLFRERGGDREDQDLPPSSLTSGERQTYRHSLLPSPSVVSWRENETGADSTLVGCEGFFLRLCQVFREVTTFVQQLEKLVLLTRRTKTEEKTKGA